MKTARQPLVIIAVQRHDADCGAAALAMLLSASYEDVLLALGRPSLLRRGVWFTDLVRAAEKFGVVLKRKATWDAEHDEGLAQIHYRRGPSHAVLIRAGLLFDTDGSVWEPDDYLIERRARFGALLVRV